MMVGLMVYTKLRWQPKNCNLPRFHARLMLEKLRNRRLVFVGDSIGRNRWESSSACLPCCSRQFFYMRGEWEPDYKAQRVSAKDYNCTVEYYRAPFLMVLGGTPDGATHKVRMTVRVDTLDWTSPEWKGADVPIINSGHWWNDGKTIRGSIETLIDWIHIEVNTSKTQVFYRTFSPVHFRW